MKIKWILVVTFLTVLTSCTNDKQSDLEDLVCVDTFTYTACVKEIIDNNCTVCHHSGADAVGPFALETYAQVRDVAENGNMLDRIQREDGAEGAMPQTGKMPQGKIDVILAWVNGGFQE